MTQPTTRTFRARFEITLDGAVLESRDHLLTVSGDSWDDLSATLDGEPVTVLRAAQITEMAQAFGTFERFYPVPESQRACPQIGKASAHELHRELGRLGHGRGYDFASAVLGREVTSLAALSLVEAGIVRLHAEAQAEGEAA